MDPDPLQIWIMGRSSMESGLPLEQYDPKPVEPASSVE